MSEVKHKPSIDDAMVELKEIRSRLVRMETRMIKSFEALGVNNVIHAREFVEATRKSLRIEEK